MASLVFIGHEASLTGAPYTQLYILQWLRANTQHTVDLVLLRGGALVSSFEKVANVHIIYEHLSSPTIAQRVVRRVEHITNARIRTTLRKIRKKNPALIFANTALTLEYATQLKQQLNIPLIINVHELYTTFFYCDVNIFGENIKKIDFFVPGSQAVKYLYQSLFNVPESKTQVVYDFTDDKLNGVSTGSEVRARFGIPQNGKIIGAIGSLGWRKGHDLFLQIAHYITHVGDDNTYFVWVGGNMDSIEFKEILIDVRLMGLETRVFFVGAQKDLRGFYEAFDVFLLTSREDPFPLVCIEAAMSGCPIICFESGGGMPEFVREDAGYVVPYGNTREMGDKAIYLLSNEFNRKELGEVGQNRATNNHTIRTIGPQMNSIINKFL